MCVWFGATDATKPYKFIGFMAWLLGDAGPNDTETGFSDQEFEEAFVGNRPAWDQARADKDVDAMWQLLEPVLCQCGALASAGRRPRQQPRQRSRSTTGIRELSGSLEFRIPNCELPRHGLRIGLRG